MSLRADFLEMPALPIFFLFAFPGRITFVFFLVLGLGPKLPARLPPGVPAFGVPGPSDDCRAREELAEGRAPRDAFRRRRLLSLPTDISRCRLLADIAASAEAFDMCVWFSTVDPEPPIAGELMLRPCPVALASRAMAALAICCEPACALTESGFKGVFAPVAVDEAGATRLPGDSRKRDGS